jgi:nucleoside-diphosphate-sugar epimerase
MRALVSGGAGQIGSHLCASLVDADWEVICVDNLSSGVMANIESLVPRNRFRFVEADVTKALPDVGPVDRIFHLASLASPPEYMRHPLATLSVNSQGTEHLLRLADIHGARFLFASTSEVYGDPEVHPQTESYWGNVNPNGLRSCYDESKRFGEALTAAWIRSKGIDARIVRIFNTYGPHSRPSDGRLVPNFMCQALRREPLTIFGDGSQTRSLCYIADTVAGIMAAMEAGGTRGEVINLGNPEEHTVAELATIVAKICDAPLQWEYLPIPPDDPARRCPDISKARALLGWEPRWSLTDGLRETARWFEAVLRTQPEPVSV